MKKNKMKKNSLIILMFFSYFFVSSQEFEKLDIRGNIIERITYYDNGNIDYLNKVFL